jgi:phage terminase large subunit-like protein
VTALVDRLRALPREQRLALYRALPPGALASQHVSPEFWARPEQALPPPEDLARVELATGGRRAGKTTWACWLFLREWASGRARMPRIVAANEESIGEILIRGPAGIWTWLPWELKARAGNDLARAFRASRGHGGIFEIAGLPPITCLSAESPGNAVGQGKDLTWADDPAAWVKTCGENRARAMFYELRVSTSEGPRPCLIVSTTAGGVQFMRRAFSGDMRGVHKRNLGSVKDNTAIGDLYKNEVVDDLLDDADDPDLTGEERVEIQGALWRRAWIDPHYVREPPPLRRVVVAVDPADAGKLDSDETGIVVVGLGHDGRLYVLADYTARWEADRWAAIVAWAFAHHHADAIVAETNRCESMVKRCLRIELPNAPVQGVSAGAGKGTRAEPLTLLYRDGQVSHVRGGPQISRAGSMALRVPIFNPITGQRDLTSLEVKRDRRRWETLEDELCGWVPKGSGSRSPNGLDALVWACWYLRPPDQGPWQPAAGSPALASRFGSADPRMGARGAAIRDPRALR